MHPRKRALIAVVSVLAAVGGFYWHRIRTERAAELTRENAALRARSVLEAGERQLAQAQWKDAFLSARTAREIDPDVEPERVERLVADIERELSTDVLLSAGERSLAKGQADAAALALQSVPKDTRQAKRRDALEQALSQARGAKDATAP